MAFLKINNVEIKGIAASVPKYSEENVNSGVFLTTRMQENLSLLQV